MKNNAPLPVFFRSLTLLRGLNVAGVGLSLAACTGAIFGHLGNSGYYSNPAVVATAAPTLLVGVVWALMLRWRKMMGGTRGRWGWALSIPLAVVNTALAGAALSSHGEGILAFLGMILPFLLVGATLGVMFWLPALLLTLLVFGLPIAWSQRQASKGLAGEERGEAVVGVAVVLASTLALLVAAHRTPSSDDNWMKHLGDDLEATPAHESPGPAAFRLPDSPETWALQGLGELGVLAGALATGLALRRERRRRRFVAAAEAGQVTGYRVEATGEGKVLVRVADPGRQGYRSDGDGGDDEELFALDEQGLATHPARAERG